MICMFSFRVYCFSEEGTRSFMLGPHSWNSPQPNNPNTKAAIVNPQRSPCLVASAIIGSVVRYSADNAS